MVLLSLVATYQLWRVPLKTGLSTYNALHLTASSLRCAPASGSSSGLTFSVKRNLKQL